MRPAKPIELLAPVLHLDSSRWVGVALVIGFGCLPSFAASTANQAISNAVCSVVKSAGNFFSGLFGRGRR